MINANKLIDFEKLNELLIGDKPKIQMIMNDQKEQTCIIDPIDEPNIKMILNDQKEQTCIIDMPSVDWICMNNQNNIITNLPKKMAPKLNCQQDDSIKTLKKSYDYARVHRAKTENILLNNRDINDASTTFEIIGTQGIIYKVKLDNSPTCTCPDHEQKHNRCKHILFMLVKIFELQDPYQQTYTKDEIIDLIKIHKKNIMKYNNERIPLNFVEKNITSNETKMFDMFEKCFVEFLDILDNPCKTISMFEDVAKTFVSVFINTFE
jgi:hypothetical protein